MGSSTVSHENRFKAHLNRRATSCSARREEEYELHVLILIKVSVPIRVSCPPTNSTIYWVYCRNCQVSGNLTYNLMLGLNRLSAIRFRGGVILQVSCYTLLMRIPTSMATVLLSAPHGTPFRVYRKVGADMVKPGLS